MHLNYSSSRVISLQIYMLYIFNTIKWRDSIFVFFRFGQFLIPLSVTIADRIRFQFLFRFRLTKISLSESYANPYYLLPLVIRIY